MDVDYFLYLPGFLTQLNMTGGLKKTKECDVPQR
jgi:hypothetical protein